MARPPVNLARWQEMLRVATDDFGISPELLSESAGIQLAALARHLLGGQVGGTHIIALCGCGDERVGYVLSAARHLANASALVNILLSAPPPLDDGQAEARRRTLAHMGIQGSDTALAPERIASQLKGAHVVLDGLGGTHTEPARALAIAANAAGVPVVAAGLPTGLDAATGLPVDDSAIRATATLALGWPLDGALAPMARAYVGALYLADIGLPGGAYAAVGLRPGAWFSSGPLVRIHSREGGWDAGIALP